MESPQEAMMLCKELIPSDPNDPNPVHLTSELRAIGSVVRATCANKTIAILECQSNLSWNGTLPSCSGSDGDLSSLSSILVIVWVIGGVLLFTLIILIAIIIGSRSKPVRRVNGQQPTEVFHISGQGEGGDNPAFSRSEERCGSSTRLTSPNSSTRLPSYEEAIRGLYGGRPTPTVPSSSTSSSSSSSSSASLTEPYFIRTNAPPSYRSSHLYRTPTSQTTPSTTTTTPIYDLPTTTTTNNRENSSSNHNHNNNNGHRTGSGRRNSSSPFPPRPPTPGVTRSSSTNNNNNNSNNQHQQQPPITGRYAESYPQCLWDEDPPPPYTPGPDNIHLYRSPGRTSQSRPAIRRSLTSRPRSNASTPPVPTSATTAIHPPLPPQSAAPSAPTSSAPLGGSIPGQIPPTTSSTHHNHNHLRNNNNFNQSTTTVASVEHPLITYTSSPAPCTATNNGVQAAPMGHFSTIHLTNPQNRFESQGNNTTHNNNNNNNSINNSLPFAPIHPANPTPPSSLHSRLPSLPLNPLLGPPLSSSTPLPVRRDLSYPPVTHVPLPPPPHSTVDNRHHHHHPHQQHSRSHSHGNNDPKGRNNGNPANNIPPRPLPRPRPQPGVHHHQRQQSAPLARLEVEYF